MYFINNQYLESYKECSDYKENNEVICNSIIPIDKTKKCSFIGGKCQSIVKEKECSDMKDSEYECFHYELGKENMKCSFVNNKCVEQPIDCSNYKGNNKDECESIVISSYGGSIIDYKCSFTDKGCEQVPISCSDYKPGQSIHCEEIKPSLTTHCIYIDGICKEFFDSCSDSGNNKKQCESNYPQAYFYKKCIFKDESNSCDEQSINCSDYESIKNILECHSIGLDDPQKKCILRNNICVEEYNDCSYYKEIRKKNVRLFYWIIIIKVILLNALL